MTTSTPSDVSEIVQRQITINERLLRAAQCNHVQEVVQALAFGANPNASDGRKTALHWAAYLGHEQVVRALLKGGANPAVLNARQETALHEVGSYLGAYPDTPDGATKALEVVGRLLRAGANPRQRNETDNQNHRGLATAVHALARSPAGHKALSMILQKAPELVHASDERGDTPLMIAVLEGRGDAVKALLAAGSDPLALNPHGVSPLLQAQRTQPSIAGHIQADRIARERAILAQLANLEVASMTPSRAKPRL